MPQYLMAVPHDTASPPTMANMAPEELQPILDAVAAFNDRLRAAGAWVFAGGLEPPDETTRVDGTGATPVLTDRPDVGSREYLGGFWVIEAPDRDAALRWAEEASRACRSPVDVRPFQVEPVAQTAR